jgi:hypothetical protein
VKRYEAGLLGLFLACWAVYLLGFSGVLALAGSLGRSFYLYDSIAAALGWGGGNLFVYRDRDLDPGVRRLFLNGYYFAPFGLIFLIHAMWPAADQHAAPLAGIYALAVFSVFFVVAIKLKLYRRR